MKMKKSWLTLIALLGISGIGYAQKADASSTDDSLQSTYEEMTKSKELDLPDFLVNDSNSSTNESTDKDSHTPNVPDGSTSGNKPDTSKPNTGSGSNKPHFPSLKPQVVQGQIQFEGGAPAASEIQLTLRGGKGFFAFATAKASNGWSFQFEKSPLIPMKDVKVSVMKPFSVANDYVASATVTNPKQVTVTLKKKAIIQGTVTVDNQGVSPLMVPNHPLVSVTVVDKKTGKKVVPQIKNLKNGIAYQLKAAPGATAEDYTITPSMGRAKQYELVQNGTNFIYRLKVTSLKGTITFNDSSDLHRPKNLILPIECPDSSLPVTKAKVVSKNGKVWTYQSPNLPAVDENGKALSYYVIFPNLPFYQKPKVTGNDAVYNCRQGLVPIQSVVQGDIDHHLPTYVKIKDETTGQYVFRFNGYLPVGHTSSIIPQKLSGYKTPKAVRVRLGEDGLLEQQVDGVWTVIPGVTFAYEAKKEPSFELKDPLLFEKIKEQLKKKIEEAIKNGVIKDLASLKKFLQEQFEHLKDQYPGFTLPDFKDILNKIHLTKPNLPHLPGLPSNLGDLFGNSGLGEGGLSDTSNGLSFPEGGLDLGGLSVSDGTPLSFPTTTSEDLGISTPSTKSNISAKDKDTLTLPQTGMNQQKNLVLIGAAIIALVAVIVYYFLVVKRRNH